MVSANESSHRKQEGALRHITGVPAPLEPTTKEYIEWEETGLVVFSWIVDNIEIDIVGDFAHHQSAKAIWDSLAVTYESTSDSYLIYELDDKISRTVQGDMDLETYWRTLHGVWINIDRCQEKPIDCCDKGVCQYRRLTNTQRLHKFLRGLKLNSKESDETFSRKARCPQSTSHTDG